MLFLPARGSRGAVMPEVMEDGDVGTRQACNKGKVRSPRVRMWVMISVRTFGT